MNFEDQIEIKAVLSSFDIIVFFLTIIITIGFIYYGHRQKKKSNTEDSLLDLLLMGRQLTLPLFVATLVATWYGGIFGVAQIAFENGIFNFVSQGIFWYLTYAIFAFFIVHKIADYKAVTLPDLIGKMFGEKSRVLAGVFNILNLVPIVYTISIGFLLNLILGIDFTIGIILGTSFVVLYSFFGGLRSVVYSDLFQFFIMISAVILVLFFSFYHFSTTPLSNLPRYYFSPLAKFSLAETFAWGLIALSTLVDPNFYQRCFAAINLRTARKGILLSTLVWIIFDLSLTLGAMYAKAIIPEADSSQGYFIYALQILPDGLRGLFLAGILATILSTLDSYIFLAGSTLSFDLVPKSWRGKLSIHYLSIIFIGILSILMATIFDGNIKAVWKTLGSISSAALLIPVVSGYMMKKRINDNQFAITAISSAVITCVWRLGGYKEKYQLDEIYIGMLTSISLILIFQLKQKLELKKV